MTDREAALLSECDYLRVEVANLKAEVSNLKAELEFYKNETDRLRDVMLDSGVKYK